MSEFEGRALVVTPPWRRGVLEQTVSRVPCALAFEIAEQRGPFAELTLSLELREAPEGAGRSDPAECSREMLAEAGLPVLGDVGHGGAELEGGPRWRSEGASWSAVTEGGPWWPEQELFPPVEAKGKEMPELAVSTATARVLARGHPWILRDDATGDCAGLLPGTLVRVMGAKGRELGTARIEGTGSLAARMWSRDAGADAKAASVEARVARALKRRRPLLVARGGEPLTDAFRLIHGEADGLPGLAVDRLGPLLRVLVSGRCCDTIRSRVLDAVVGGLAPQLGPDPPVVEVLHLRRPPRGRLECVRLVRGALEAQAPPGDGRVVVHELGLAYLVDPGLRTPDRSTPGVGLFLDQRENRRRLMELAGRGGHWLNLFAHTGAFSVALLAAGAHRVTSVDLSAAWLRWLDENLALNRERGVSPERHRGVRGDGRRFLAQLAAGERFQGIILDPPTAAAAGRHFWSVARDLRPLVEDALVHLKPGGVLLVSRNDRRGKKRVDAVVRSAAESAGVSVELLGEAPAGIDFPRLQGFEEGESFKAVLVRRLA